jgi:hypothetical protein
MKSFSSLMKSNKTALCYALLVLLYCPLFGQGTSPEILRFEGGDLTPIISDPNVTVSDITFGPGVAHEPCTGFKAMSGVDTGDSLSALIMGDYFEFTVTPNPGYAVTIDYIRENEYASNHLFVPNTTLGSMYYQIGSGSWKNANQASRLYELPNNFCSELSWDNHYQYFNETTDQSLTFRFIRWIYGGNPLNDIRTVRIQLVWAEGVATTLPIELSKFNAEKSNRTVLLNWQTESETQNDYFQIEHSLDGKNYITLDKVEGAGNSAVQKKYQYSHRTPFDGLNYYRLKQTDFDGSFEYSKVVQVDMSSKEVRIYPNPVAEVLFVESKNETDLTISIYDNMGKLIRTPQIDAAHEQMVNVSGLIPGIYYMEVIAGGDLIRKKIVKK